MGKVIYFGYRTHFMALQLLTICIKISSSAARITNLVLRKPVFPWLNLLIKNVLFKVCNGMQCCNIKGIELKNKGHLPSCPALSPSLSRNRRWVFALNLWPDVRISPVWLVSMAWEWDSNFLFGFIPIGPHSCQNVQLIYGWRGLRHDIQSLPFSSV